MGTGGSVALVEDVADKLDGDEFAAEDAGLVYLLLRRRDRHEDNARHFKMAADEGKPLRMVAGRSADERLVARASSDRLAQKIEGAADLVGTDRRQVLTLQPDICAVTAAEMLVQLKRSLRKDRPHRRLGIIHTCLHHINHPRLVKIFIAMP
ncbi:hypothetical protein D3C80_959740 [compost metagenome]